MPLPAATTRSPGGTCQGLSAGGSKNDRTLCEAPLYVLLKHPSRRRSDPWGFVLGRWVAARALGALGVGCFGRWVRGRVAPGALGVALGVPGRRRRGPPAGYFARRLWT